MTVTDYVVHTPSIKKAQSSVVTSDAYRLKLVSKPEKTTIYNSVFSDPVNSRDAVF